MTTHLILKVGQSSARDDGCEDVVALCQLSQKLIAQFRNHRVFGVLCDRRQCSVKVQENRQLSTVLLEAKESQRLIPLIH